MPAVARLGDPISCGDTIGQGSGNVFVNGMAMTRTDVDLTVGHCFAPTTITTSNPTVQTNNIDIALVGDAIIPHTCKDTTHGGNVSVGSPDVFFGEGSGQSAMDIVLTPQEAEDIVTDPINVARKQVGVSSYTAAIHDVDDEGAPTPEGAVVPHSVGGQTYVAAAAAPTQENVDITTPPTVVETATPPPVTSVSTSGYDYADIDAMTGTFPGTFRLSPNFTLASVSTSCAVSHYSIQAQTVSGVALSVKDIIKNLRDLCYNILEPIRAKYPGVTVNSGFRQTINGRSQHEKGQAVDMAFPGMATDATAAFERAKELTASTLPFDQFIFEQNRTIWFHMSYSKTSQRRDIRTKPKGVENPKPGLFKVS